MFFLLLCRAEKELWIREKFVEKKFVRSSCSEGDGESPTAGLAPRRRPSVDNTLTPCHCGSGAEKDDVALRLYRAALAGDLVAMASALAEGAEVNGSIVGKEAGRTALIGAAVGVKTSPSSQRSTDSFI